MPVWRVVALTMAASAVAQAFGRFAYALLLPAVTRDLDISYTLAGAVGSANLAAYLAGSIAASYASTRFAPETLLRAGTALSSAALGLAWWSPSVSWLVLAVVLAGFAGAIIWIPAPGITGRAVPARWRGAAIGLVGGGIGIGVVFSSALAGALRSTGGDQAWRTVYGILSVIGAVVAVLLLMGLRASDRVATGPRVRLAAVKLVPGWRAVLAAYTIYGLAYSLFTMFLVATLEVDMGLEPGQAARVFLAFGVATIPGGILFGAFSDRLGRRTALTTGFVAMAMASVGLLTPSTGVAIGATLGFGLSFSGIPAVIAAAVADHLDARGFGAAFGAFTVSFGISQIAGPQLGGFLFDQFGTFAPVYWAAAAASAAGAYASTRIPVPTGMGLGPVGEPAEPG